MRRRSRLEASRAAADRSLTSTSTARYLLCSALVLLTLSLPIALLLRSARSRVKQQAARGTTRVKYDGDDIIGGGIRGDPVVQWRDWTPGGTIADAEVESSQIWGGIAERIPSKPKSTKDIHIVFSTDCSPYQNYQSIMLFNSAERVGQGSVTRVASGCTDEEQQDLQRFMDLQPERFRVHFTPDYSIDPETGEIFMFYNKPNGMAHFLKHAKPPVEEAVIALLDPDMILVSPLTPYVGNPETVLWHNKSFDDGPDWVEEGKPVGQFYGLGGSWTQWNDLAEITMDLGSNTPSRQISADEAAITYPVGPPYMMHPRDWTLMIELWVSLAPKVYKGHQSILAEMYAFCIAAAHRRLRHRVAYGLMVSDSNMPGREGWPLVDPLGASVCDPSAVEAHRDSLPPVVHYCQLYRVGTYMFGKRHKSHHNFFSCAADSYEMPPVDYLSTPMAGVRVHPPAKGAPARKQQVTTLTGVRQGYAMCTVLQSLNMAQASYKSLYCKRSEISGDVKRFTDLRPEQIQSDTFG